ANLYSAVQPGGSLFGLQESNPVDADVAYKGPSSNYGTAADPMIGAKIGGVNVFGGGLARKGRTRSKNRRSGWTEWRHVMRRSLHRLAGAEGLGAGSLDGSGRRFWRLSTSRQYYFRHHSQPFRRDR